MIDYKLPAVPQYSEYIDRLFPEDLRKIKTITFQVTENCNLKCTYCYQTNKSTNKMSFDIAKMFLDKLFDDFYEEYSIKNTKGFVLDFIGGDPLLEIDLIEKICDYYFKLAIEKNRTDWLLFTAIDICTNGLLYFDNKFQSFLKKYYFYISLCISIDGNKKIHDACRIDFNGNGSYDRAIEAVHHYKNNFSHKMPSTKMTLSPYNICYTSDALINLIHEGYTDIPCNCVYEKGWELEHAQILYRELKKVADYLMTNFLYNKINIRMFREDSYKPMNPEDNQNFCGGVSNSMLALDYKGNLCRCIRFMESSLNGEQPPIIIGSVEHGIGYTDQEKYYIDICNKVTRKSQSTEECFNCSIATGCAWCSAYCYQDTGSVNKRVTYTCIMHKAAALANVYYWNSLYKKLGIDKVFINYVKDEDSLSIIGEEETKLLKNLESRDYD